MLEDKIFDRAPALRSLVKEPDPSVEHLRACILELALLLEIAFNRHPSTARPVAAEKFSRPAPRAPQDQ